jgi:ribonuclease VapC
MASLSQGSAYVSSVNLAEVLTRLIENGTPPQQAARAIAELGLRVIDYSAEHAMTTAILRGPTRTIGASLGDRACLALAAALGAVAVTADRQWAILDFGLPMEFIR